VYGLLHAVLFLFVPDFYVKWVTFVISGTVSGILTGIITLYAIIASVYFIAAILFKAFQIVMFWIFPNASMFVFVKAHPIMDYFVKDSFAIYPFILLNTKVLQSVALSSSKWVIVPEKYAEVQQKIQQVYNRETSLSISKQKSKKALDKEIALLVTSYRTKVEQPLFKTIINHELTHINQQYECWIVGAYIIYWAEFLVRWAHNKIYKIVMPKNYEGMLNYDMLGDANSLLKSLKSSSFKCVVNKNAIPYVFVSFECEAYENEFNSNYNERILYRKIAAFRANEGYQTKIDDLIPEGTYRRNFAWAKYLFKSNKGLPHTYDTVKIENTNTP